MLPEEKLGSIARRYRELEDMLCRPEIVGDRQQFQRLSKERSEIEPVANAWEQYAQLDRDIHDNEAALGDPELRELAEAELPELQAKKRALEDDLRLLLLPTDPADQKNVILEIRAGEGGEEAALFAADLFKMYARYAEGRGWRLEVMNLSEASAGGYKEMIALVSGRPSGDGKNGVYSQLRFEGGVHRVQRVPATETQGRIHTSTATVAVLPEAEEVDVHIDEARDLEISIAASGGPGGQGVNTTNSAVQLLHKPTGIIVKCQDERSQIKNKAKALKVLRSRLLEIEREKADAAVAAERRGMVSTGERSMKVRTYNYPQNRVTDHRIKLTLNKLDRVVNGDLGELISALQAHRQAELLRAGGLSDAAALPTGSDDD
ncbi:MAG: peptide chain release factor 1 [Deltaproteobacteria bacterium]|nr:peptide chain release factor 1 [Deltaproteobacteria bacterium]